MLSKEFAFKILYWTVFVVDILVDVNWIGLTTKIHKTLISHPISRQCERRIGNREKNQDEWQSCLSSRKPQMSWNVTWNCHSVCISRSDCIWGVALRAHCIEQGIRKRVIITLANSYMTSDSRRCNP